MVDRSRWTVSIQKNVASVPTSILEYTDATNDSPFVLQGISIPARVARIMSIEISDLQSRANVEFYVLTYTLEFRPETWALKILDQGLRYKDGSYRKQIVDDSTPPRPVTSPMLLNGSGAVIGNPAPDTAVFLTFHHYPEKDFGILPKE